MSEVAVVILNYNGELLLPQFLPSVIRHSPEAQIFVVDNFSTDNSLALLEKDFSQVRIIKLTSNLGFCGGYNEALQQIEAKYYVLLNSDVEATSGWLKPFITLFESNANVSAAQPKVLSYQDRQMFEYAGAGGGFIDKYGYPFCRGRIFNVVEKDHGLYNDTRPIFWATGACLFIRSETFHRQGGFDESFFAHMEEIDLCWRIQRAGQMVYYVGNSTVYHLGGGTLDASSSRKTYFNFRNGFLLLMKNLPAKVLFYKLPIRILLDWIASLTFLIQGKPGHAWAVARAHASVAKNWSRAMKNRNKIRESIPSFKAPHIYQGSIVMEFFLNGRKGFSDLKKKFN